MENSGKRLLLNVKYYITTGPLNKRINEKPFYSYLDKKEFNIKDIYDLLKKEKIDDIYVIDSIKIQRNSDKNFENMKYKNYVINESEFIVLELHFNENKKKKTLINSYEKINNDTIILHNKINKVSENIQEYDLIYLYASPFFKDEEGHPPKAGRISYREEINTILKIMKAKEKRFKCLFKCASLDVLKEVLSTKKTKVLHISSHGELGEKYNDFRLILENLDKYGNEQKITSNVLKNILIDNAKEIKNIDLIVLSNCHSGGFMELFKNISSPKYIIYVNKKDTINDYVCILFCEHFYSELSEGKSIYESFFNAKNKLKSDSRLTSFKDKDSEIDKLQIFPKSDNFLSPYAFNGKGKLSINAHVKIQFDSKKYRSMIGRNEIIMKVLENINSNKYNQDNILIVYGSKGSEKLDFMESLGVYLFERKIIYNYEIYNESEIDGDIIEKIKIKIDKYQQIVKNEKKKYIIIIQIEEKYGLENTLNKIEAICNNNEFFYFIILIDNIKMITKNKYNCFSALLKKDDASELFNELLSYYGYKFDKGKLETFLEKANQNREVNLQKDNTFSELKILKENYIDKEKKSSKLNNEDDNHIYEHRTISKIVDYFYLYKDIDKINLEQNKIKKDMQKTECAYLFLLSKMPKGLPDHFVRLIFKSDYDTVSKSISNKFLDHTLISQYSKNSWYYINSDIEFDQFEIKRENEKQNINNGITQEDFEKYSIKYMLEALKLYTKILYYYIKKERDKIMYPDENFHFIFNSYNNKGIWTINIPPNNNDGNDINENSKNRNDANENDINENDFIYNDFNINNHRENIINLIDYLVGKLDFIIKEYYTYIDYLLEILLLFPSFFFLKKICRKYIEKCKEFCSICIKYCESDKENNSLLNKFKFQNAKLSLFLFSIYDIEIKDENDFPEDKLLISELKLLKFIKKGDKNDKNSIEEFKKIFEDIIPKKILSNENKSIKDNDIIPLNKVLLYLSSNNLYEEIDLIVTAFYALGRRYYQLKNFQKSEDYLNELNISLPFFEEYKFLETRIKIDLCYILLNKINSKDKEIKEIKEKEIEDKIKILDILLNESLYKELSYEEFHLRQKFNNLLKPNIIMLNSNPLDNGYSIYSSGIYAYPNNQYYILERLREIKKEKIKSHIRLKTYVLNKNNLIEALQKNPEVLIIQSDDFTENGDIIMESDEGTSKKLTIKEFNEIIGQFENKLKFKAVFLCFINSSKLFESIIDKIEDKIKYEYLIYFKSIKDIYSLDEKKILEYNKLSIESIIKLISFYNEDDNDYIKEIDKDIFKIDYKSSDFKKSIFDTSIYKINNTTIINSNNNSTRENGIFFTNELPNINITINNDKFNYYYYKGIMSEKIRAIIKEKGINFYISRSQSEIYKKLGFEIIKYFYRHNRFSQFHYFDMRKDIEKVLILKKENETKSGKSKHNKNFYFLYNYENDDTKEIIMALVNNSSYIIINEYVKHSSNDNNKNGLQNSINIIENEQYSSYRNEESFSEPDSELGDEYD